MKKRIISILMCLIMTMPFMAQAADETEVTSMRGVWVSTVYNLDYPTKKTVSESELKKQADDILDNAVETGLNTIFLQVRPSGDAFYKSEIFPWSHWLTGTQGTAPENNFDPLAYWVEQAHKRGLELHAWINPYRASRGLTWEQLDENNPAKLHPEWVEQYSDGNYYYNPALSEVRQLIVDGALEIVNNYDVDGLHLDDYFYPGQDFNDAEEFAKYGAGFDNIADWRRDNVNQMVAMLDSELHKANPNIQFGISPAGIWANKSTDPRGSDTKGNESYVSSYADSLAWIEAGTIDYIMPQIYWEIGHSAADFATLVDWWIANTQNTDVKLYIGLAAYKCHDANPPTWSSTKPILDSLEYMSQKTGIYGEVYFRYQSLNVVDGLKQDLIDWYKTAPDTVIIPENAFPDEQKINSFAGAFTMLISAILR